MAPYLLLAAFPFHHVRQMWQTWKPWEGYWTDEAGQMFLGMCPPLSVSYDPVHSECNVACVCCSQLEWKYFWFCTIAPGEESCTQTAQSSPLWLLGLALTGATVRRRLNMRWVGVWHLNCQEKCLSRALKMHWSGDVEENSPTSLLSRLRSYIPYILFRHILFNL